MLTVGVIGAAHAGPAIDSLTVDSSISTPDTSAPTFGTTTAIGGSMTHIATPAVGNDASAPATNVNVAALTSSTPALGGTSAQGNGGGFRTGGHTPGPTPEPITMGLSIAGLGLAARRMRRRSK